MQKRICWMLAAVILLGMLAGCTPSQAEPTIQQTPQVDTQAGKLETTQQRRDAAEAKMREMMSILWQVDRPITYSYKVGSGDPSVDADKYIATLEPGKVYSGLPYTHGSGDEISFADFGEKLENGVLRMKDLSAALISGGGSKNENNMARIGNDCADAVYAAWAVASESITFSSAAGMTPKNGCIPVGEYKTADDSVSSYGTTKDLCKENGEAVMFAAYAQLQKADGLSVNTKGSGAHAMLVSEVHVVKNGEEIDPEESYVLVHEQTGKYFEKGETRMDEALGQEVYVMGGVDRKYTFRRLFKAGYLPVTCKEFIEETPLAKEEVIDSEAGFEMNKNRMFAGALSSNYAIMSVTVEVVDKDGQVLQQQTCYGEDSTRTVFLLARFEEDLEQAVLNGSLDLYTLPSGEYTCRFKARLSTGLCPVAREFTFTV